MSNGGEVDGYLREFDDNVRGALELVMRDLVTAGISRAQSEALVLSTARDHLNWFGDEAGGQTALRVTEALQESIIEDHPEHCWPACPDHPTHPMWIDRMDPDARWSCPKTGRRIARLGELSTVV